MSGFNWSTEDIFKLIEMFKAREELWNTKSEDYKNRHKKHDAWIAIANEFNLDKIIVEKKMRSLVGQFNRECKAKSGSGADVASKWFAFKKLIFLRSKNNQSSTVDGGLQSNEEKSCDSDNTVNLNETENTTRSGVSVKKEFVTPKLFRKRKKPEEQEDTIQHAALNILKNICVTKKTNRDEIDTFGEYVSMKLRKINNSHARETAQHHINNILYNASIGQYDIPTTSCSWEFNSASRSSALTETSPSDRSRARTSARAPSQSDFSESSQDSTHS